MGGSHDTAFFDGVIKKCQCRCCTVATTALESLDGAYWALYEGDEYATASAADIVLTDGGVYKLIYETF